MLSLSVSVVDRHLAEIQGSGVVFLFQTHRQRPCSVPLNGSLRCIPLSCPRLCPQLDIAISQYCVGSCFPNPPHESTVYLSACSSRSVTSCCVVSSMSENRPSASVSRTCIALTAFSNSAVVCLIVETSKATVSSVALILPTSVKRVSKLVFCSGCFGLASPESAAGFPRAGLKYLEKAISGQLLMCSHLVRCSHVTPTFSHVKFLLLFYKLFLDAILMIILIKC